MRELMREVWECIDTRTGTSVTMFSYPSQAAAEAAIEGWRARDRAGGRPDLHSLMPYLGVRLVRRIPATTPAVRRAAAKARVSADRKRNVDTPKWIRDLAEGR